MVACDRTATGEWMSMTTRVGRVKRLLRLSVAAGLLLASPALASPPDTSGITYDQRLGQGLPLASGFRDQAGHALALRDVLRDRPAVLALGYFNCPSLCGLIRDDLFASLAQTGLRPGIDYRLVFMSIDPAETPADAARAMASDLKANPSFGAGAGWHFLTGDRNAVEAVEAAVGYHSRYDASLKQFIHPAGLVFVTSRGIISGYLLGVGYQPGDVRAGLLRARDGGIARAALQVLLICFHYDETTGRYSLAIVKLLRLAAGATVLTILALLVMLRRRMRLQRVR